MSQSNMTQSSVQGDVQSSDMNCCMSVSSDEDREAQAAGQVSTWDYPFSRSPAEMLAYARGLRDALRWIDQASTSEDLKARISAREKAVSDAAALKQVRESLE